ncbi:unnamed protein product [Schistocephalus solidus]|uniref:Uncharacterized protein n=1 Tax=Schistocephalus solidus TaxID=70667 RepID=A0A183SGS3_SCHSO|nr:unnamed protein product [Schistocephalus solidus]
MIRGLLQYCHARLCKYRQRIDQEKARCCEFRGEYSTKMLQQRVTELARELKATRDAALENIFRKLPNPKPSRSVILVHSLSSTKLTKVQLQVLWHEAYFKKADAKPVSVIVAVESVINQTAVTVETKNLIRHQVFSLLVAHKPHEILP